MKLNGLDINIIRGETASLTFLLNGDYGRPLILLNEDMFDNLVVSFKVKSNSQTISSSYLINKALNINDFKRFDEETIIDTREYLVGKGTYDKFTWSGCILDNPFEWPNQLFYHPDLNEYRYYENSEWVEYSHEVVILFDPVDTKDLPYATYFYDLVLEASNGEAVEYENVLINQHRFSVVYRV